MSYQIHHGDNREVLKNLADNSIDSVVTDPPYELGFMGKSWDATGVAYSVELWQEVMRVLKPGGHLLAFSGSRTYHRMAVAIEDAGFEIRDQIMWIYGSGFPKSHDVSKGIDKSDAAEKRIERQLKFCTWMRSTGLTASKATEILRNAKVITENGTMAGHFFATSIDGQPAVATAELFDTMRPYLPQVPEWVEEMVRQRTIESENFKKREVVGTKEVPIGHAFAGEVYGGDSSNQEVNVTAPATAEAKQWQGWGTALKPAHEPIVVARKPLIGTVAANVLTYGVGGLNIDKSRIVAKDENFDNLKSRPIGKLNTRRNDETDEEFEARVNESPEQLAALAKLKELGRWPANVIHDGSDEVVALFPTNTNISKGVRGRGSDIYANGKGFANTLAEVGQDIGYGDSGSAARFFYCAKASKRDRNEGLDGFELKQTIGGGGLTVVGGAYGSIKAPGQNHHPTVKPTELMRYLCRLVTPPGGIVLDPFMGSGSTGKAAMYEGFEFVGIELTDEYLPIAKARIEFAIEEMKGRLL
jgi:DNA modification methylase